MELKPEDIRIDTYANGSGIFHMRILHLPSAVSVGIHPEEVRELRSYFRIREVLFDRLKKSLDADTEKADTSV